MGRIRLVLFDLDGTLVDSAPDLAASANELRRRRGLPLLPYRALREVCGSGARGLIWAALRIAPDAPNFELVKDEFLTHYGAHLTDHLTVFPGIYDMIRAFSDRGISWGVVTNKFSTLARPVCEAAGFTATMKCLVGGDMVDKPKPEPLSLQLAMRTCGFAPENTMYVGDDARDTMAAHAAGLPAAAACWGYTGGGEDLKKWGSDFYARTPSDILKAIDLIDGKEH